MLNLAKVARDWTLAALRRSRGLLRYHRRPRTPLQEARI